MQGFLWRSIMLGVLIALFSGPLAIVVIGLVDGFASAIGGGAPQPPSWSVEPSVRPADVNLWLGLAIVLIAAPLGESLIFVVVHWVLKRLPLGRMLFVGVMGVFAYVAHGGMLANLAQAAGFMLMAAWYAHLVSRYPSPSLSSPVKIPYFGIVLGHVAWNATAILWVVSVSLLISGMSANTR